MEKTHFVINVGRQLGSGGKAVAEELARRLKVNVYDKRLIEFAAQESGIGKEFFEKADETRNNLGGHLRMMLGLRESSLTAGYSFNGSCLSGNALFKVQSDVIRHLSYRESCIFVGRCADYILRDHPRCLNVFVTADEGERIARIARRMEVDEAKARTLMEKGDRRRADYYNFYSNRKWGVADTYHLCINSSAAGIEGTAEFILQYARQKLGIEP